MSIKTILLIDDSLSLRLAVKMALLGSGYQVVEASNGKEALGKLKAQNISMAICDIHMPEMDGMEFVKAAKGMSTYKYLPIMMLTTDGFASKKEEGRAAGVRAWMVKPFTPSGLVNAVRKICPA